MATTVNNAFAEFMKEKVNLDQEKTKTARSSNVIKLRWPIKILASEMMLGSFYFVINAWHMIRNVRPLSLLNDNEVAKAALVIKNILIARR